MEETESKVCFQGLSMKETQYKDWSLKFHNQHAHDPIVVQIEFTYQCPLHCLHCYSDCYNNPEYARRELSTNDIKKIIDKLHKAGSMWLCFTGGDPMLRDDFIELYDYARNKGFLLTIFTSLAALTDEMLSKFIEKPPFSIEITLNAATEETYEKISQVEGLFDKVIGNIKKLLEANLPLKIKTMLTKNNIHEKEELNKLIESFGCEFRPSTELYARLNGDTTPCQHRLPVDELVRMPEQEPEVRSQRPEDRRQITENREQINPTNATCSNNSNNRLFRCATGNWPWHIDPDGKLNICSCAREPSYDILDGDLIEGVRILSHYVKSKRFKTDSKCKSCELWALCRTCPGKAKLEIGDEEAPIPYYCELAKLVHRKQN